MLHAYLESDQMDPITLDDAPIQRHLPVTSVNTPFQPQKKNTLWFGRNRSLVITVLIPPRHYGRLFSSFALLRSTRVTGRLVSFQVAQYLG